MQRTLGWTVVLVLAMGAAASVYAAEGEPTGGRRGERWRARRAEAGKRVRKQVEENLPGAKEENERHEQAMQAIREKLKTLGQEIKQALQAAPDAEAKKEAFQAQQAKLKGLAGEIVDERLNHAQKILDLRKANRDQAVEATTKLLVGAGIKAQAQHRRTEGHPARQPMREQGPPASRPSATQDKEKEEAMDDGDLAEALQEALR